MIKAIEWDYIVIHHSLTKDYRTVSWQAIRRYHMDEYGWSDIGYHFGVERVNNHIEALIGRPIWKIGAHVKGHNHNTLGVCVVGNWDKDKPPQSILRYSIQRVVIPLLLTKADPMKYVDYVVGHNFFNSAKSCPGKFFDMDEYRDLTRKILQSDPS